MEPDKAVPHVYKVSNPIIWYVFAVIIAVMGISVKTNGLRGMPPSPVTTITGLVTVAVALYMVYSTAISRLAVSAEGVVLRGPLGPTTVRWDQVREIRVVRGSKFLILGDGRAIAVGPFGSIAPDTAWGQDLRRYLPQLFKADKSDR